MAEHGIKQVSTMYTGAGDIGLPLTEELRRMTAVADLAVSLGVPLVTVLGSATGTKFSVAVDRLRAIREIHAARGLSTCMKTHRGLIGEMPGDSVRLCEAVPDLGLTLEASHFMVGANQGEPFWQVIPHVRHVTLRDARIIPVALQMAPGYGDVDFGQIISRLHERGYEGKFAVEYEKKLQQAKAKAKADEQKIVADGINEILNDREFAKNFTPAELNTPAPGMS